MGTLKVNKITGITGVTGQEPFTISGDTITKFNPPAGMIIQVVESKKTDTDSVASATWNDIDGTDNNNNGIIWCCKITPRFSTSKILVSGSITVGQQDGNNSASIRFLRDSTAIAIGDAAGSRERAFLHLYLQNSGHHMANVSPNFLDEPSTTNELTYKAQFRSESGSYTTHINRSHTDSDSAVNGSRAFSNLLLMEISG